MKRKTNWKDFFQMWGMVTGACVACIGAIVGIALLANLSYWVFGGVATLLVFAVLVFLGITALVSWAATN